MQTEPIHLLDVLQKEAEPIEPVCATSMGELDPTHIRTMHQSCGHPGIKRTHYFIKLVSPEVSKAAVQEVVRECKECQSIDPAPVSWKAGRQVVCENC